MLKLFSTCLTMNANKVKPAITTTFASSPG